MYRSDVYHAIEELGVFKIHGFWGFFKKIVKF